jgi:hypothetical protein
MPKGKKDYFPKVREAREALKEKALDLFEQYDNAIKVALANGEYDVALKHLQWLIEHMPAEDGERMVDASVNKEGGEVRAIGPQINLGIMLGGVSQPGDGPKVIEVTPLKEIPKDVE